MFSFLCANCGNPEILHVKMQDLLEFVETDFWPNLEYREDSPLVLSELETFQEKIAYLFSHKKGYRYSLKNCTGFKYRQVDCQDVINTFSREGGEALFTYLPDEWKEEAEKRMTVLDSIKRSEEPPSFWGLPVTTFIVYDPTSGQSVIGTAE